MVGNYKVVTLCGSTKFKDQFMQIQSQLTLQGYIVISVGCFGHSGDIFTDEQKVMLDDMHKRKIDMADEIFVINVNGYIGNSTKSEIEYAKKHGKTITYLNRPENIHARWREVHIGVYECTSCWEITNGTPERCPYCNAKMDE